MSPRETFCTLVGAFTYLELMKGTFRAYMDYVRPKNVFNIHGLFVHRMFVIPSNAPLVHTQVDQMYVCLPYPECLVKPPEMFEEKPAIHIDVRGFRQVSGLFFDELSLLEQGAEKENARLQLFGHPITWDDLGDVVLQARCEELMMQIHPTLSTMSTENPIYTIYPGLRNLF